MKLDFLVPGFGKCGTTSLCSYLASHPEVFIPKSKEPAFFAYNYEQGWPWYETFFQDVGGARICGEGSTFYATAVFEDRVCERVLKSFPDVRFIFIARDPLARLESSYRELHNSGHSWAVAAPFGIGEVLQQFPNMLLDTFYWKRISAYRRHVPDSRIHVLFLEDLSRDPETELAKCFQFLGVDPTVRIEKAHQRLNAGDKKLYDSKLMRRIRTNHFTNWLWETYSVDSLSGLWRLLGLRKAFRGPLQWDRQTFGRVMQELAEDARQFLRHYGKPSDFWELVPRSMAA